jgi:hydrogenase/urease accessory protein HupE
MRKSISRVLRAIAVCVAVQTAQAHQEPTSFLDLHLEGEQLRASLVASTADLAHELADVEPAMLLNPVVLKKHEDKLAKILLARLHVKAEGTELVGSLAAAVPLPDRGDVRLDITYQGAAPLSEIAVECRLFPYDPRHRTYLNFYQDQLLSRQEVFEGSTSLKQFTLAEKQGTWPIIREFTCEGVRHIFIGPDHILFVIGLLLLGGSLGRLLRIITAFTVAHSITLCLATFEILSPPANLVEPVIALSIVVVGIHAFLGSELRDPRLWFAFAFGLIHGFGFASVLQEMELPRHALGVALFAFNAGVEIGQVCIILAVAPLLALLRNRQPVAARHLTNFAALCITTAGAFWFFQRVA